MSRPFRCSARPTARKPTARTTIAMIAQITTRAVSHIRGLLGVAMDALLRWSLFQAKMSGSSWNFDGDPRLTVTR
jgi:hypothetical protein